MNAAGKSGLLLGLVGAILSLLSYLLLDFLYSGFFTMFVYGFAVLVITIAVAAHLGLKWRKSIGGFASFGDTFKFLFLMLNIAGVVNLGVEVLLYHVIEPDLQKITATKVMGATENIMLKYELPDDQIDETLDKMEDSIENLSVMERLATFKWRPLLQAFMAIILSLFIKKEKPLFES